MKTLILLLLIITGCYSECDGDYKNGDVIYPDYAISDTLVVLDACGLNKDLKRLKPSTDLGICNVSHMHCGLK